MKVITIIGRLTKDCEVHKNDRGEFAAFSVAVDDGYGENKGTIYFGVSFWRTQLAQYLTKGTQVGVTGDFKSREYNDKTYFSINATDVKLLGNSTKNQSQGTMNVPEAAAKVSAQEKARYAEGEKIEVDYSRDADLDLNDEIPF